MNPCKPHRLMAAPPTLHAQMEIVQAIRTLAAEETDEFARRRAEISAIRRGLEEIPDLLRKAFADWCMQLQAELRKYSPDQPRVPKGNRHGGEWTKESEGIASGGSIDSSNAIAEDKGSKPSRQYTLGTGTRTDATTAAQPQLPPAVRLTPSQIVGSYLAGAGNYVGQQLTAAGYYAADALSFGAASESAGAPPTFEPFPVTSRYFASEGAATVQGVTTVVGAGGLGAAIAPDSIAVEARLTAAQRVAQLAKDGLRKIEDERFVTLAVTETREGVRVISSSSNNLEKSVIDLLQEGERGVNGVGHAEVTGIEGARSLGLTPTGVAASRPICGPCANDLAAQGIIPLTPLKR